MQIETVEARFRASPDGKAAVADNGMVATAFPDATQAGVEILRRGGNAVDAACAAAFALGVCEPQGSGLGGQSMAILYLDGKTLTIDGSGRVPALATIEHFRRNKIDLLLGYRATTVPTTVAVLGYLSRRYGRLSWPTILQPAIRIAAEGYRITPLQHDLQTRTLSSFFQVPDCSGARYFLKDDKTPYLPGERFRQPELARTLEHLAEQGPSALYRGRIAEQIDTDMRAHGGFLRADDLARIPWPIERPAVHHRYRQVTIASLPPPAAGQTLLLTMSMLNQLPSEFLRSGSKESRHYLAETFRKAFLQRCQRPYDPATYPPMSREQRVTSCFAQELAASIHETIDPDLPRIDPPQSGSETTHLSVMDADGNAVGITQSIELVYGSKAAADGLGFLYNNYMDSLDLNNPAHPFYLRPNASPWTSVAPALVFYNDALWMVTGSPGSERIYSAISQFLMHMIDGELSMAEAMEQPRLHCSIGGKLSIEAERFAPEIPRHLEDLGYRLTPREPYSFYLGAIHAVLKSQTQTGFQGVAEVRRDGIAGGL